jgi:glucose/arabinose dehydrogenase
MKQFTLILALLLIAVAGVGAQDDEAETVPDETRFDPADYQWTQVVAGLDNPILLTNAGDGTGRMFAVEQNGFVLLLEDGTYNPEPFLDVTEALPRTVIQGRYSEQGLLGMAFHPEFATNGEFFIAYTKQDGGLVVARFNVLEDDPNRADPESGQEVLVLDEPFDNHNAGMLAFGPDGYLYVAIGDGGGSGDPLNNGQKADNLYSSIIRIDIDQEPYAIPEDNPFLDDDRFAPEIWVMGLRNPWRFSFDRENGDMYIADVGQERFEEISFVPGDVNGGLNFGWATYEGNEIFKAEIEPVTDVTPPIIAYDHSFGCSVTGGYAYRGEALAELDGVYIYGDYCNGNIWFAYQDEDGEWQDDLMWMSEYVISSFGEDEAGEVYLVDYKGEIYRLDRAE